MRLVFDTLYHAVALETESFLVTADDRYLVNASKVGRIIPLRNWSPQVAGSQ